MSAVMSAATTGLARAGGRFWRWWTGELAACLPAALVSRLSCRDQGLAIAWDGEAATVLRIAGVRRLKLARATIAPGAAAMMPDALARHLRRRGPARLLGLKPPRVRLHLPADAALQSRLVMPMATAENLGDVLRFELDRRTPFSPDTVRFAWRVSGRDQTAGTLTVALTVVPRHIVNAAADALAPLGLALDGVEVAGENGGPPVIMPAETDGRAAVRRKRLLRLALASVLAAAAFPAWSLVGDGPDPSQHLRGQLAAFRARAVEAKKAETEIARLRAEIEQVADRHRRRLPANEVLTRLSRLLRDDTWLFQLALTEEQITMGGYSGDPAEVLRLLERSPYFEKPAFSAAVTRDDSHGKERFVITVRRGSRQAQ